MAHKRLHQRNDRSNLLYCFSELILEISIVKNQVFSSDSIIYPNSAIVCPFDVTQRFDRKP